MSLNLNAKVSGSFNNYCHSATYIEAVNDAQFVRQFGIAALITFALAFVVPGTVLGAGLAVLGFGKTGYYRNLGIAVITTSLIGGPSVASAVLCVGIWRKGRYVLNTLAREGKGDPDWEDTRRRATVGIALSAIVLLINFGVLVVALVRFFEN